MIVFHSISKAAECLSPILLTTVVISPLLLFRDKSSKKNVSFLLVLLLLLLSIRMIVSASSYRYYSLLIVPSIILSSIILHSFKSSFFRVFILFLFSAVFLSKSLRFSSNYALLSIVSEYITSYSAQTNSSFIVSSYSKELNRIIFLTQNKYPYGLFRINDFMSLESDILKYSILNCEKNRDCFFVTDKQFLIPPYFHDQLTLYSKVSSDSKSFCLYHFSPNSSFRNHSQNHIYCEHFDSFIKINDVNLSILRDSNGIALHSFYVPITWSIDPTDGWSVSSNPLFFQTPSPFNSGNAFFISAKSICGFPLKYKFPAQDNLITLDAFLSPYSSFGIKLYPENRLDSSSDGILLGTITSNNTTLKDKYYFQVLSSDLKHSQSFRLMFEIYSGNVIIDNFIVYPQSNNI